MDDSILKTLIHDLLGPISVIGGFLRTLDVSRLSGEDREYHSAALRGVERIMGVVEKVEKDIYSNM